MQPLSGRFAGRSRSRLREGNRRDRKVWTGPDLNRRCRQRASPPGLRGASETGGGQDAQENLGQTLQATALVHKAHIRLVDNEKAQHWDSRGHFFSAAAESMWRILVENAHRKGGPEAAGEHGRIELTVVDPESPGPSIDLLALLAKRGDSDGAFAAYDAAIRLKPGNAAFYADRAFALLQPASQAHPQTEALQCHCFLSDGRTGPMLRVLAELVVARIGYPVMKITSVVAG